MKKVVECVDETAKNIKLSHQIQITQQPSQSNFKKTKGSMQKNNSTMQGSPMRRLQPSDSQDEQM